MRKLLVVAFGTLAAAGSAQAAALVPREVGSLARHEHALVQLERGAPSAERAVRRAGGVLVSRRLRVWRLPSRAAQRLVPGLAVAGSLREFESDVPRTRANHGSAGDPLLPSETWLVRVGADRVEPPGPGKPVTVIDSAVDLTHPEFAGRPDTRALNAQLLQGRREFHGTAVASVVAAPANGVGIVGVYPRAALNVWDASANGGLASSDVIAGLAAAASAGPGVVNLSLGGPSRSRFEAEAILDALDRGSIVVAAVGNERNEGSPLAYPANLPHVLTVAATGALDSVSAFSSRAPGVDLAAPGEQIPVALPTSFQVSGFGTLSGTSFAAPIVAGAVAWIWTVRPSLDPSQVMELVRRSARDLQPTGRDQDTGFGLLDIPAALAAPEPSLDPLEPNDGIEQVRANGLFERPKAPLTAPGRPRGVVSARLDLTDDPRDVYRVWVPAGRRVTATLRTQQAVALQLQGARPARIAVAAGPARGGTQALTLTNRSTRGRELYVSAFLRIDAPSRDAAYTLTVTTASAPRRQPSSRRAR